MALENDGKFNLKLVHDNFHSALHDEDDVRLKYYLDSYEELNKFFSLMGTIFGFVSKDLRAKMDILIEYLSKEDVSKNFATVKTMILYEKENALLEKKDYVSGSRTLLRLHRGLDFIREFLRRVGELKNEEHTASVCREAYDQTLAQHHSFLIRKGAKVAMYALPTRENLFKKVCGQEDEIKAALEILPKTLEVTAIVYERIETIYRIHDLNSLP